MLEFTGILVALLQRGLEMTWPGSIGCLLAKSRPEPISAPFSHPKNSLMLNEVVGASRVAGGWAEKPKGLA